MPSTAPLHRSAEQGAGPHPSLRGFHTRVTRLHLQRGVTCCRPFLTGEALASFISTRNTAMGWDMCYTHIPRAA